MLLKLHSILNKSILSAKFGLAFAGIAALSACGGGDGTLGSDISAAEVPANRGGQFSLTQTMKTSTHLLSSMNWQVLSPTQSAPSITLSNADCAVKIQQDSVYLPKTADHSGSSDWTCTVFGTVPSGAPANSVYSLLLTGIDDVGNTQTTKVPVRIN